jgi:excisionase family DNA binding protein
MKMSELLTVEEAAKVLRCRRSTLYGLRARGQGPPVVRVGGGRLLYPKVLLLEWLSAQRETR